MTVLLPPTPVLGVFLGASIALAIIPGPGVLYIVTRSLTQGRTAGLRSVAGVALGNLSNATAAALGLAAWLAVSSVAFEIVKLAGACYLVYLGLGTLFWPRPSLAGATMQTVPARRTFRDAFVVALLNPKTTLFFAAFLPQFMRVRNTHETLLLGMMFVGIASVTDTVYALSAGAMAPALHRPPMRALGRRLGGGVYLALGLYAAFGGGHRTAQ